MIAVRTAKFAWWVFAAWFAGLTVLSSIPGQHFGESPFSLADKTVHGALFFAGAVLLTLALLRTWRRPPMAVMGVFAWIVMAAIGVLDEYHQLFTPGRSGMDPGDISADAIGAAIGVICACLLHARRPPKTSFRTASADRAA